MRKAVLIVTLVLVSLPSLLHAQVYKVIDEDGKVAFTNVPPADYARV